MILLIDLLLELNKKIQRDQRDHHAVRFFSKQFFSIPDLFFLDVETYDEIRDDFSVENWADR